ncbi:metal-dependent hydrolase [Desulfosporosinus sp. FKA]|uniref:metal-dependent hydrolase n=1 Tax=Desulfosporosinus sp. FKA TaxID=1969834 RepID=UPI000B4A4DE6|nr:metal-dependent hydrolase [Desulfosporosinus sp. FKA]
MFVFGHVGLTTLTARVIEKSTSEKRIDYRLVVIGSLLPDLIDKPIGRILFRNRFESGRVYAHTLAFVLVLISIGLYRLYRYKKIGWLVLAGGSILHAIFDQMWMFPKILFWPFLSGAFNKPAAHGAAKGPLAWVPPEYHRLIINPYIYIPEIIGAIVIIYFVIRLYRYRGFSTFLKTGTIL